MVKNTVAEEKTLVLSRSKPLLFLGLMFIITLFSVNMASAFNFTDGSLVAYYPMNETTGSVRDVSMTGHDGWVGNAFNFDGEKDYAEAPFSTSASTGSFCSWINPSSHASNIIVASMADNSATNGERIAFQLINGDMRLYVYKAGTPNRITADTNLSLNTWYHACWLSTGTEYKFYLNNIEQSLIVTSGSNDGDWFDTLPLIDAFALGTQADQNKFVAASYFNGSIDEVGFWTKELSGTEITSLYNSGSGKSYSSLTAGEKTNLVSYYSLDEVGSDPLDSHGSNDGELSGGTNNGATRGATGIIENAFYFDGSSDYIDLPNLGISGSQDRTVSFWFNATASASGDYWVMWGTASTDDQFLVRSNDADTLAVSVFGDQALFDAGSSYLDSQWHHVVAVLEGTTTNDIKLYLDNVSLTNYGNSGNTLTTTDNNYRIGERYDGNGDYLGDLDEPAIWNRALNSTEISELYNNGTGLAYEGGEVTTPTVTLVSPANNLVISDVGTNFTVSGNEQSGFTWENLTYNVWNENGSLHNSTVVSLGSVANFTNTLFIDAFTLGEYTWNAEGCYTGTSDGCSSGTNRTLIVGATVDNQTFSNSTYETSTETFNASIELLPGVVIQAAYLWYDGTRYTGTVTTTGTDVYDIGIEIDIPLTPVAENKTWFWNFVYTSPTQREQNGTSMLQEVEPIDFAECDANLTTLVLNMTVKEEGTFGLIDSNLEFNADYWLGDGDIYKNLAYANTDENKSNFQFCTSNNESFIIDDIISYWAEDYERREYFLSRATLNNNTMNLNLYLLNTTITDTFTVKVQDENDADVSGAFVYVQRWDIGTGNFHTIGMVKTSSDGSGILNLRLTDAWYRFQVIYNEVLYLTTEPKKESTTSRTLKIDLTEDNPYDLFEGVSYSLTFDETTNLSVFTYSDPTGAVQVGCLKVLKMEGSGNTEEYYSCVESTAGTLSYQIPDDGTYIIRAIFRLGSDNDNLETVIDEIIRRGEGERFQVTGRFGQFISLMITGTMAAIGIAAGSIPLGLALIFISLVVENLLGWLNISSSVLYGLLTVLILVGFSLRRGR